MKSLEDLSREVYDQGPWPKLLDVRHHCGGARNPEVASVVDTNHGALFVSRFVGIGATAKTVVLDNVVYWDLDTARSEAGGRTLHVSHLVEVLDLMENQTGKLKYVLTPKGAPPRGGSDSYHPALYVRCERHTGVVRLERAEVLRAARKARRKRTVETVWFG